MQHGCFGTNNVIRTKESIYWDSPIGKSEVFLVERMSSLQKGFYGDCQTCLSVAVCDKSAFLASEQGVVATVMSFPNSTAVGTPFTRMIAVHDVKCNVLVKASANEILFEGKERDSHNFTIEVLSLGTESFEVLNRNISIIFDGGIGNIPDNLANPILHEIGLIIPEFSQFQPCLFASSICIMLESATPFKYSFASSPDVLSKILLGQDLPFGVNHGNRKAFAIYVDSNSIGFGNRKDILFIQIGDNLQTGGQSIGLASPSIFEKCVISLPVAIFDDWDGNRISWIESKFDKIHRFGGKGLAIARHIKLYSNSLGDTLASPNRTFKFTDNLDIERGVGFGS